MYLLANWSGCCRIETMAEPIVGRLVTVKGSLPES